MYTGIIVSAAAFLMLSSAVFCSGHACSANVSRAVSEISERGAEFALGMEEYAMESLASVSSRRSPNGTIINIGSDGVVSGWALDPDDRDQSIKVRFFVDGEARVGTAIGAAFASETDASLEGKKRQGHWFTFALPDEYKDGQNHTLYAYGMDITEAGIKNATLLKNSPKTFTLGDDTSEQTDEADADQEEADEGDVDQEEGGPKQLKVMSYNVRQIPCTKLSFLGISFKQCDIDQWDDSRTDRRRRLIRFLRDQFDAGVDVVVLQEVYYGKYSDRLIVNSLENLKTKYFPYIEYGPDYTATSELGILLGDREGIVSSGLVLLSRYPVGDFQKTYFNVGCAKEGCYTAPGAFYAGIDVDGTKVDVFGTHLEAYDEGEQVRVRQIDVLKDFIDTHKKVDNVFLVGDMNTSGKDDTRAQSFAKLMGLGYASGAEACKNDTDCDPSGPQVNAYTNNKKLDYVLFDSATTNITDFEVLEGTYRKSGETLPISDHKPIVATFEIN